MYKLITKGYLDTCIPYAEPMITLITMAFNASEYHYPECCQFRTHA